MNKFCIGITIFGLLLISCIRNIPLEIKIGHSGDFSGPYAYYDAPLNAGAKFAIEEINSNGGVLGKPLKLISKDCKNNYDVSNNVINELIDDQVVYIIGTTSDPIIEQGKLACQSGIPISTGDGTAPTLVDEMGNCAFQICMSDNMQAAMAAEYAYQKGYRKTVLIFSAETPYTKNLPIYFQKTLENLGGQVIGNESYEINQKSYSDLVKKISELKPDVIFTPMYIPDTPKFMKELRLAGLKIPVISTDGNHDESLLDSGDYVDGLVFTTHGFPTNNNKVDELWQKYKMQTGEFPKNIAFAVGYDEIYFLKKAIESTNSFKPEMIIKGLNNVSNFEGVLGRYTMNSQTRQVEKPVTLIGIENGRFILIDHFVPSFIPEI